MRTDLMLHAAISAVLAIILSYYLSWIGAVFIVLSLGVAKELFDFHVRRKCVSADDLKADAVGVMIGTVIFALLGLVMGL